MILIHILLDLPEFKNVLRVECDHFGQRIFCIGYSQNHCSMQWDQKTESEYSNCGATRFCISAGCGNFSNITAEKPDTEE